MKNEIYSAEKTRQAGILVDRFISFVRDEFDTSHVAGEVFIDIFLSGLFGNSRLLELTGDSHWQGHPEIRGALEGAWLRSGDTGLFKEFERWFVSGAKKEGIGPDFLVKDLAEQINEKYFQSQQ